MVDALCFEDLDMFGKELDDPLAELEQDLFHRLIEPRGSNPDDPDRGLGLNDALSGVVDASLKHRIEDEFLKDDRVSGCNATISSNGDNTYRIDIDIEPEGSLAVLLTPSGVQRLA